MAMEMPAVSVIVPMYNTEKYISELLDSVLGQTLENFELIIADNGSNDKSSKIVERYLPKFDGRLKLITYPTNTGGPSIPRNKGLELSRGKYVFFMDSDDVLTKTALEEMYNLAEKFQADVVYCEKYFMSEGTGENFLKNIRIADTKIQNGGFVDNPEIISNDLETRIKDWLSGRFWMTPWLRLSLRDYLIKSDIKFPNISQQNDKGWAFENLCLAKKFVRVPNICYIRRMRPESLSSNKKTANQSIKRLFEIVILGLKMVDSFMGKVKFFQKNPEYRFSVLHKFCVDNLFNSFSILQESSSSPYQIYEILKTEFKEMLGENDVLISCLLLNNIMLMKEFIKARSLPGGGRKAPYK